MEDLSFNFRKAWENDGKTRKGNPFPGHFVRVIDIDTIEKIIGWYLDNGGDVLELEEGCLGYGKILCTGIDGYQSILITEFYVNEWSCNHKFRVMSKVPQKYIDGARTYYETWYAK